MFCALWTVAQLQILLLNPSQNLFNKYQEKFLIWLETVEESIEASIKNPIFLVIKHRILNQGQKWRKKVFLRKYFFAIKSTYFWNLSSKIIEPRIFWSVLQKSTKLSFCQKRNKCSFANTFTNVAVIPLAINRNQ